VAPREVDVGPCREVEVSPVDLGRLPIPWFFEHQTGPYVTAGAIVARDPDGAAADLSIARCKSLGAARAMVGIAPNHHLAALGRRAGARGETLPIAVTIGNHPAVLIVACLYLALGADELECARRAAGMPGPGGAHRGGAGGAGRLRDRRRGPSGLSRAGGRGAGLGVSRHVRGLREQPRDDHRAADDAP
jgi:hypothetical protein